MGEKRKPYIVLLLKKQGKTGKMELFDARLWGAGYWGRAKKYRIRVNGKWFDKRTGINKQYYLIWEIRDLYWKSLALIF